MPAQLDPVTKHAVLREKPPLSLQSIPIPSLCELAKLPVKLELAKVLIIVPCRILWQPQLMLKLQNPAPILVS